jgi:hypothetical protein
MDPMAMLRHQQYGSCVDAAANPPNGFVPGGVLLPQPAAEPAYNTGVVYCRGGKVGRCNSRRLKYSSLPSSNEDVYAQARELANNTAVRAVQCVRPNPFEPNFRRI